MKTKVRFIINPFSGTSRKTDIPALIASELDQEKYEYLIKFTEYPGHARVLAKEALDEGVKLIVSGGGDGTVNEIAEALVHTDAVLAALPCGSGNGFAMHLGMGRDVKKAIHYINHGKELKIDTCVINNEFFINVAGVGFDAWVAYKTKKGKKRGFFMYLWMTIREAFKYKANSYNIQLDDELLTGRYLSVAVANATMYGYNFKIAPEAQMTDGLFDVVIIKHASKFRQILASIRFLNDSIHKSGISIFRKSKNVSIKFENNEAFHYDGEGFYSKEDLNLSIVPNSINVLIPKDIERT